MAKVSIQQQAIIQCKKVMTTYILHCSSSSK